MVTTTRGRPRPSPELLRVPDRRNVRLEWIANAYHNLFIEAPERTAELVNEFIIDVGESR